MVRYIQYRYRGSPLETVDECETIQEARYLLGEYRLGAPAGCYYYVSQRCCNEWRDK